MVYRLDMRVLGRIRLSRLTEESTSAARQRDIIEAWAKSNDHEIVGWAEDLDVSGSVDPFATPALGSWFDRENEWDILCAWKLDRIGRRAIPLNHVFGWMMARDKTLVCVSDNIDLSTWVGRLVANVIAGVAEGELEAIRERNKASRKKLLETGRWAGGHVPFGFVAVPLDGGGWKLAVDHERAGIIRQMVADVCAGESLPAVAEKYNWPETTLRKTLKGKHLIGHATYQGQTVRDPEGNAVLNGEPILTLDEWERLQGELASRSITTVRKVTSPLQGVVVCKQCGRALQYHKYQRDYGKRLYRYYYCKEHKTQIDADTLEGILEGVFLDTWGDSPVMDRVYRPAEDHQIALNEAVRAVDELTSLLGHSLSKTVTERLTGQLRALDKRIAELESLPAREAGWEYTPTGQTFRDVWDTGDKRSLLLDAGFNLSVTRHPGTQALEYAITQKIPPPG